MRFSRRVRQPFRYESFSKCSRCGQAWPSSQIFYSPQYGWACPPCFDGLFGRDQILQPIFPYEGTRKTPSPVVDSLNEGISPGNLYQTYTLVFEDQVTGLLYSVNFNASSLSPTLVTEVPVSNNQNGALAYIEVNNEFRVMVMNGHLTAFTTNPPSCPNPAGNSLKMCDFGSAWLFVTPTGGTYVDASGVTHNGAGLITYTPPGGDPTPVNPSVPQINCTIDQTFITETFENSYCDTPNNFLTETFES